MFCQKLVTLKPTPLSGATKAAASLGLLAGEYAVRQPVVEQEDPARGAGDGGRLAWERWPRPVQVGQ